MKNQRISRVANFFAFNLLFFALYLNFIHQDVNTFSQSTQRLYKPATILAESRGQQLNKSTANNTTQPTMVVNSNASKISLN